MDIRFLIVGAPFIIAFFYTLFWLGKCGAFKLPDDNFSKKNDFKKSMNSAKFYFGKYLLNKKLN